VAVLGAVRRRLARPHAVRRGDAPAADGAAGAALAGGPRPRPGSVGIGGDPMSASPPPILGGTGGVAGTRATCAARRAPADRLDAAADRLRDRAVADDKVLAEPDLLESAVLSPVTFAEAEARVMAAADGVHGALRCCLEYETDALLVRATMAAFEECDRLV